MLRLAFESARRKRYSPAGSTTPGTETGALIVTIVLRSGTMLCAIATPAVSTIAAAVALIDALKRPINFALLKSSIHTQDDVARRVPRSVSKGSAHYR